MKKTIVILMAVALVLGMTQCKKDLDTVNSVVNEKVYVTFSTGNSRTNITEAGLVSWTNSDTIHVYASTTGYLGKLNFSKHGTNTTEFTGWLTECNDDETLRFYYLGTNEKKNDNTFVIDYFEQDGALATIASKYHVSCFTTKKDVNSKKTVYEGQMLNQMSLAVFDVADFGAGNVKIYAESGFRNKITISATGELTYGVAGVHSTGDNQSGHIVIGKADAKKYVALLPSDGEITMRFTSQSKTGDDEKRTIKANDFIYKSYNSGDPAAVKIAATDVASENYVDLAVASSHVFSVAAGKTVKFAKGNLVYDQGRFKMHKEQHGRCFTRNVDVSSDYKVSGTFDLFGWGTAGWNNGNKLYMPYTRSKERSNSFGYGATDGANYNLNLTDDYKNSDWGVYQFGMDAESGWRTLTKAEWQYLLKTRTVNGGEGNGYSYTLDQSVQETLGIVIYPDDYTGDAYSGSDWATFETAGCVFLPAAGYRNGTSVNNCDKGVACWSVTHTQQDRAFGLGYVSGIPSSFNGDYARYIGVCVRLVR